MQEYYEELWERLPETLALPDFELRERFLLGGLRGGERVLDLGCGSGEFTAVIARRGARAVGVDVAEAALRRARSRHPSLDFRRTPFDGPLPLSDSSFDLVWSSEVLEHVADTAKWMSEVRRVLVPRGRLLLTTPAHGRVRVAVLGVERFSEPLGDHLHLYTRSSLRGLLADFGFGAVAVRTAGGPPLLRRLLLGSAER